MIRIRLLAYFLAFLLVAALASLVAHDRRAQERELAPVAVMPPGDEVTVYPVIGLPPSLPGGVNATCAEVLPGVTAPMVGASGTVAPLPTPGSVILVVIEHTMLRVTGRIMDIS